MHDVAIVGAGPVGLLLGILLRKRGIDVVILEQRRRRSDHSRAIGIHPPALAVLAEAGVAEQLVASGVRIRDGVARRSGRDIAVLDFGRVPGPHPYVLAVPQVMTERILEQRLRALGGRVHYGRTAQRIDDGGGRVTLEASRCGGTAGSAGGSIDEGRETVQARLAVAADGARSTIRDLLKAPLTSRNYPDTYLMGDFADNTSDGDTAVLYLEPDGIVESFPLPGGLRRWVVRTHALDPEPEPGRLADLISGRTGRTVDVASNSMLSSFAVRSRRVRRMVHGRVALIGDAAHEISPIGGQGMNLGWLDAAALAPIITAALQGQDTREQLRVFDSSRRAAAATAGWQAHLNMALGRPLRPAVLDARNSLLLPALAIPGAAAMVARRFTMH
ncbi:FAD-dependent oxidoreductase [Arthrobacter crystallopoietes]|uniref:2-polyprenyl-6-methoxyphenol hydroxylase n=1 Tax=Crystallibacter crystallopoietes TaxID=37928 RepID=A0A1H1GM92_9MICC|nr:NAD(P)/FAD-dependent oxidoreductase [Arthrobacter crystallopoietes]AUI52484.1 FAD-binding monooxygenase [Arthrobacter crystallopoietes]SDR14332.1 2-polyprenyl-6-methoxyphenol hydroxylase [Arthrobacter crystallopoietes]